MVSAKIIYTTNRVVEAIRFFLGLLILLLATFNSFAQHHLGYEVGIGAYKMDDMHALQDFFKNESEIEIEAATSFPPYLFYQILYSYGKPAPRFGLNLRYTSTGGRLATSDYSGSLFLDQLLNMYSIGVSYEGRVIGSVEKLSLRFRCLVYYDQTNLKIKNTLKIGQEEETDEIKFKSSGFSLLPLLLLNYQMVKSISASFNLGYEINPINNTFRLKDNKNAILSIPDGDISPDWTGYRFSIRVVYSF